MYENWEITWPTDLKAHTAKMRQGYIVAHAERLCDTISQLKHNSIADNMERRLFVSSMQCSAESFLNLCAVVQCKLQYTIGASTDPLGMQEPLTSLPLVLSMLLQFKGRTFCSIAAILKTQLIDYRNAYLFWNNGFQIKQRKYTQGFIWKHK